MSAPKKRGGSWVGTNYDKVLLLVVLLLLLLSVGALFLIINGKRSSIMAASWDRLPQHPSTAGGINTSVVASINGSLSDPIQIPLGQRRLAVGPLRVACVSKQEPIAYDATNCPFCGAVQPTNDVSFDSDQDGMPDWWEKKYNLNPMDPADAAMDSDGDGFTNLEEYQAGTDPRDPTSKPDPRSKLRVAKFNVEPFKLRFLGVSKLPSGNKYQLNLKNLERTYFVTNGETVEGVKVSGLDDNDPKKPVLILQQGERSIRLVQNEVINEDSFSAVLISLIDKKPFKIAKNQQFKLGDTDYNVVDITREAVVIRDAKNGRESNVPRLTEDEKIRLRGGDVGVPEMRRPAASREGEIPVGSTFDFPQR